ncbi:MAG: hypothetical protein WHS89_02430 [Acidimicrobiales bacterium]
MRPLYLHEVIDIRGEQAVAYMEHSVLGFRSETADRGLELYGTWYVMGSTGRWPQVVNIWEMADGWDGWERLCRSTNLRREANEELTRWWREAYERRTGGFDRLLGSLPGTRTLADLAVEPITATLFVHELTTVRPGAAVEYLEAVRDEWAPIAADHGHTLVGLFEVLLCDTEVCTLWATDLESHVAMGKAADAARGYGGGEVDADERILAWRARARELTTRWREELMIPCPGTPMGPDSWAT